jgi:hypothetical protein
MTIRDLIKELEFESANNLDLPIEFQDASGQEFSLTRIYYEGTGPVVIIELED